MGSARVEFPDCTESIQAHPLHFQNVIVMRHGDRLDNFDPLWITKTNRPWDPPLTEDGLLRAFNTGCKFRELDYPIHRVFVSPFLRCIQTASKVVFALLSTAAPTPQTKPSRLKVSIEYGLCEMLNNFAIRNNVASDDTVFTFELTELEKWFPADTVDRNVEMIYKEMPNWGESVEDSRSRYNETINGIADRYPSENIVVITHGIAVGASVRDAMVDMEVIEVEYCAYAELKRVLPTHTFQLLTHPMKTGIQVVDLK